MNITIALPARLLPLLVPDGGTLDSTWVVCFAHRPTVKVNGVPALAGVDAWQPFLPLSTEAAAREWAERWARANCTGIEQLSWTPIDHDGSPGEELFVEFEDGGEEQADIGIIPLTSLSEDYQPAVKWIVDDSR